VTGFDLIREPWIPCVGPDGARREFGLRELLVRAHELREILDPAPPVTVALHRLVLAVLHRVFGPADRDQWRGLWDARRFDPGPIDEYLEAWRDRFDLFHSEFPFYQTPGLDLDRYGRTAATLVLPLAAGNNATLFDHTTEDRVVRLAPAEAARWLVTFQAYAPSGTLTRQPGESPSAQEGPLRQGAAVLVVGETLFETLLLNLVRYDGSDGAPFDFEPQNDRPAWEAPPLAGREKRAPLGYLDLLTWQSRCVLLGAEGGSVTKVVIMAGRELPSTWIPAGRETMLAYRVSREGQDPFTPLQFEEERALWRDSPVLFHSARASVKTRPKDATTQRPKTLDWVGEIAHVGFLGWESTYQLSAAGIVDKRKERRPRPAAIKFWRHERLPLPLALLRRDRGLVDRLEEAVHLAERVSEALESAAKQLARLTFPETTEARHHPAGPKPERDYWPRLDSGFRRFLFRLGAVGSGDSAEPDELLHEWASEVKSAAWEAFVAVREHAGNGVRTLRAFAKVEGKFRRDLGEVLAAYQGEVVASGDAATVG